jgi:hypothetical protein
MLDADSLGHFARLSDIAKQIQRLRLAHSRVAECIADSGRLTIPACTEWEHIGNQINAALIAAVAVFTPETPQFCRHELPPAKPDNPVRSDRRRPRRNSKPRHRTCWSCRDIR